MTFTPEFKLRGYSPMELSKEDEEILSRATEYRLLRQSMGFSLLMKELERMRDEALDELKHNEDPTRDAVFAGKWRERVSVIDAINEHLGAVLERAKELEEYARG